MTFLDVLEQRLVELRNDLKVNGDRVVCYTPYIPLLSSTPFPDAVRYGSSWCSKAALERAEIENARPERMVMLSSQIETLSKLIEIMRQS